MVKMQDKPDLEKLLRQSEANPYALDDNMMRVSGFIRSPEARKVNDS